MTICIQQSGPGSEQFYFPTSFPASLILHAANVALMYSGFDDTIVLFKEQKNIWQYRFAGPRNFVANLEVEVYCIILH
jgi:hypothetical protein